MDTTVKTIVAVLMIGIAAVGHADTLYVICNSGVSLDAGAVRDAFVGEKSFAGDVKLVPADNSAAQASFLEKILKMDAAKYSTTWTKKSFREGLNPPPMKGTDAEALEFVKRTPGACSYVTVAPPSSVTVVVKF